MMSTDAHCVPSIASWQIADNNEYFIQVSVITCERFSIDIEQFIARCHDERCSELSWTAADAVLTVPARE